jgi:hypothetical protein
MPNEKWEIFIYKTLHRKQKIAQHEPGADPGFKFRGKPYYNFISIQIQLNAIDGI